jgi:exopolyphosphatase/guanosine-5'-triphosphate,3'-diphosphate pyrophosphatase
MATAAVRDAEDGAQFVAELEKRHGIRVEVISGEREAKLGAYGVLASIHRPEGISADLGGGSLELARLFDQDIQEQATLRIGSLRLLDQSGGEPAQIYEAIAGAIGEVEWLQRKKPKALYAIGGSFRALARIHVEKAGYPLHILHHYTVPSKGMPAFLRDIIAMPPEKIATLPGMVPKRAAILVPAAMVLERLLETIKPEKLVFSASGIREGYLYEKLSPYVREEDALLASCTEFAVKGGRNVGYCHELYEWMEPLFDGENDRDARLRFAACLLHDIARFVHPDYRAEWAMHRILQSNLPGIDHAERVQLSLALYHRYQFRRPGAYAELTLIGARARAWARVAGAAMNLAYHLTGGVQDTLPEIKLKVSKNKLALHFPDGLKDLAGEAVKKRLDGLDEAWRSARD